MVTLPTGFVTPCLSRLTVTLRAAPVFATAVNVTLADAVPVVEFSDSHAAFSDNVQEQPIPVAVTLSVPVPPPLPMLPLGVEIDSEHGFPAACRTVATADGPPVKPVSRNVTVAVRCESVGFASKLTVTIWLFADVAGVTEVIQESLAVAVQAQFVPPLV